MGINCSKDQISDFSITISKYSDYCFFDMAGFDEAYRIIYDKCDTLKNVASRSLTKLDYYISQANIAITKNKSTISEYDSRIYDIKRDLSNCEDPERKKSLQERKERLEKNIDDIIKMDAGLQVLISNLHKKMDTINQNIQVLNSVSSSVSSIKSNIETSKHNFSTSISSLVDSCNYAMELVSKIDMSLSEVSNTSTSSSKIIKISDAKYLFNMANSLNDIYNFINDSSGGYANMVSTFTSVIQDEVSRGVASKSEDMLRKFEYELGDFPKMNQCFKNAGNALINYEKLKK